MSYQVEMVNLEELVSSSHQYRQFNKVFNFSEVEKALSSLEKDAAYKGYGAFRLFKCLLLQFMEDISDRELERYIQENNAAKWFCDFGLTEKTPDHSVFSRIRKRIGTNKLSQIFTLLREQLKKQGFMSEVFTFVDATHLIAKANLWEERDAAIKKKYYTLNNKTLEKVAKDKQAKIGCKGCNKYWYGYKKHKSVDMQSGLINKVAVTAANVTDNKRFKHVCPSQGAAYADKGYCLEDSQIAAKIKKVHLVAIKKNNMKDKNKDLDRWITKIRIAEFMKAICFNLRRVTVIKANSFAL